MTPLAQAILNLDLQASALRAAAGHGTFGKRLDAAIRDVRRASAAVRLADIASHHDDMAPAEAFQLVAQWALDAGLEFPELAGIVNRLNEHRLGDAQ